MPSKNAAGFLNGNSTDPVLTLAQRAGLTNETRKPQDIRLESRVDDKVHGKPVVIATYFLDLSLKKDRGDAFYEEVYKVLHAEKADLIHVSAKQRDEIRTQSYPKDWIERQFKHYVLGEGSKPSTKEVEELVAEVTEDT